jgi:hypothetical protein
LKRGSKHGIGDEGIETKLVEFFGGIKERVILFSAETGISAGWVAERISELLSPSRERVLHQLSIMRVASTRDGGTVEPLALAVDAHQRETQSSTVGTTGKAATNKTIKRRGNPWDGMTPEQKSKEMKRRRKVAKRNKKLKAAGKPIKPLKKSPETLAKQNIYVARSNAKKARALAQALGKPLPPMPPLPGREV